MEIIKAGKWRAILVILIFLSAGYGVSAITNHTSDLYYDNYIATYWVNSTSTKSTNYYLGATSLNARLGGNWGSLDITTTGDVEATNVNATEFYQGVTSLTDLLAAVDGGYDYICNDASTLESTIEGLGNNTKVKILANWVGDSTSSIVLPAKATGLEIEVHGLGIDVTTLLGDLNEEVIESDKTVWAAGMNMIRLEDIEIESNSDQTLYLVFWHCTLKNVKLIIYANDNAKGATFGGAGADAVNSYWENVVIIHKDGVTTNSLIRLWYECFTAINTNIVLTGDHDIDYVFECMGTSATFIKVNLHQWSGRDITGAVFRTNGDGFFGSIFGFYGAESGGTSSIVNSFIRVTTGDNSRWYFSGSFSTCEDDMITQIFYDEESAEKTRFDAVIYTSLYDYYPPPQALTITLWIQDASNTTWENPGASLLEYPGFNSYTVNVGPYTKAKIYGRIKGNEAGSKTISAYDTTNNAALASYTWSGTSPTNFESDITLIQTTVGNVEITLAITASSATEDIQLCRVVLVLFN